MILTNNLVLVPLSQFSIPEKPQVQEFVGWLNDPEVVKYSEHRHHEHSDESQMDYWECVLDEPTRYLFIKTKNGGKTKIIGAASATYEEDNLISNISILIGDKTCWGKGYGKEVFAAMIENERLHGMEKVTAGMMETNEAMIRTALACGMTREAVIPGYFKVEDTRIPLVLMGLAF
tara:strand:- start:925 stop:1452 length:528 start_codon:yes stop_codon:yes gene_type:complete